MPEASANSFVNVNGFKLFYRVSGDGENTLLCLHGGPGMMHDYLLPLAKLGSDEIKVVLYDQLGCGNSEKPPDFSHFNVNYYVEEVEGFRKALGLGKINLMGSSWGGMLALAYALKYQENLKTIISTGGLVNSRVCANEMSSCRYGLPRDVQETLAKYEALWAFWHPDYLKAVDTYYHHFFCRLPDWPEEVTKAVTNVSVPVYFTMWGPNEFTLSGNLKDLDFTDRLGEIHVPTLVTGGRFDEVTPRVAETIHSRVPNSVLRIFEKSAHLAMWEEQDAYLETVRKFIRER